MKTDLIINPMTRLAPETEFPKKEKINFENYVRQQWKLDLILSEKLEMQKVRLLMPLHI